jgi:serine/threonine-protein kinase RsbW
MADAGYPETDCRSMRVALQEAVANAVKHGNHGDPSRQVRIRVRLEPEQVLAEVEDEGEGFDPGRVADPRAAENLERPGGRGLLMMRHYTDWVRHNEKGNRVTLCRRRPAG